jgi:hypothetical protein
MGQGIGGMIQLAFETEKFGFEQDRQYFSPNYFDYYDREEKSSNYIFTIKPEFFLSHYNDMLHEFYDAIGVDLHDRTEIESGSNLLQINDFDDFKTEFSHRNRNGRVPFISDHRGMVSVISCRTDCAWLFYGGSYKAYLEEYSTFTHFERVLAKLMKNPLANIIKFGQFG